MTFSLFVASFQKHGDHESSNKGPICSSLPLGTWGPRCKSYHYTYENSCYCHDLNTMASAALLLFASVSKSDCQCSRQASYSNFTSMWSLKASHSTAKAQQKAHSLINSCLPGSSLLAVDAALRFCEQRDAAAFGCKRY